TDQIVLEADDHFLFGCGWRNEGVASVLLGPTATKSGPHPVAGDRPEPRFEGEWLAQPGEVAHHPFEGAGDDLTHQVVGHSPPVVEGDETGMAGPQHPAHRLTIGVAGGGYVFERGGPGW